MDIYYPHHVHLPPFSGNYTASSLRTREFVEEKLSTYLAKSYIRETESGNCKYNIAWSPSPISFVMKPSTSEPTIFLPLV
jgi:hypothetical protein